MSHWIPWAEKAIAKIDSFDEEDQKEYSGARKALVHVRDSGYEPYMSLKAFVAVQLSKKEESK